MKHAIFSCLSKGNFRGLEKIWFINVDKNSILTANVINSSTIIVNFDVREFEMIRFIEVVQTLCWLETVGFSRLRAFDVCGFYIFWFIDVVKGWCWWKMLISHVCQLTGRIIKWKALDDVPWPFVRRMCCQIESVKELSWYRSFPFRSHLVLPTWIGAFHFTILGIPYSWNKRSDRHSIYTFRYKFIYN